MYRPEATQQIQCGIGQGYETIFIAFGIANMDTLSLCVKIADFKT